MTLPAGFKQGFEVPANRKAVYDNAKAGNELDTAGGAAVNHAVAIAGYDNAREAWLIWSSWGAAWGDGGFARVSGAAI
jgi:C1A family cysteine protease